MIDFEIYVFAFVFWMALKPFQRVIGFTVPDTAAELKPVIRENKGVKILAFQLPLVEGVNRQLIRENVDLINIYIEFLMHKYGLEKVTFDAVKHLPFRVSDLRLRNDRLVIEVVSVDNPLAVEYLTEKRGTVSWADLI